MGGQISTEHDMAREVSFKLHGEQHTVRACPDITPATSLNTYLRNKANLRDTKVMCREGGCGACIVAVTFEHPVLRRKRTFAVNSCLVPVLACHNWEIDTIHGIGNRTIGYHPLQVTLAKYGGSQCGFCSGGMIMNMYALQQSNTVLTQLDIEDSFGGNLCRCTGYRPILDAFKSLAVDADPDLVDKYPDIEDIKICSKSGKKCEGICKPIDLKPIEIEFDDCMKWYKAYNLDTVLYIMKHIGNSTYRFVAGNTGQGVYSIKTYPLYWIDIRSVKELISYNTTDNNLNLGANVSITDTMDIFMRLSEENGNYWYLRKVRDHLDFVANVPVRNMGTLAGNLSLKHDHHEFPSDIFLLLETIGAQITIVKEDGSEVTKSPAEYINYDMNKSVMKSIKLYPVDRATHFFGSYKICPRVQNAHAYVNAAFLIKHDGTGKVVAAKIVYGGISPDFIHAKNTEAYLVGKKLFDNAAIQGALESLSNEVKPEYILPESSPEFRKNLTRNLFYKFLLTNAPEDAVNPKYRSGGKRLQRKLTHGTQFYQTDPAMYPVTKPVPKVEGLIQCAGEAEYVDDMPSIPGEVFAAFVLAESKPHSRIINVDVSEALKMPGVIKYVNYKDIPGKNAFNGELPTKELLFAIDVVQYNGQPIGLIIAQTEAQANAAVPYVKITFEDSTTNAEYTIKSILKNNDKSRIENLVKEEPARRGDNNKHIIKGDITLKEQYHFAMETQRCLCIPTDNGGYDLHASTQWMDLCQKSASQALNIPMCMVNVVVKRIGGAYGSKLIRASLVSTACAVAAHAVQKPVRLLLPLITNMKAIGKRFPSYAQYEVSTDDDGVIQSLDFTYYQACGTSGRNEEMVSHIPRFMKNPYMYDTWKINGNLVHTDMAGNSYARSPGASEGIAFIETIMDHIAHKTGKDPAKVRKANILKTSDNEPQFIDDALVWAGYYKRMKEIKDYNNKNRWMKKGLSISVMDYHFELYYPFSSHVAIFAGDGTVAISHGGIECGQGINTKATIQACKTLLKRLEPFKEGTDNITWKELVAKAHAGGVLLVASHIFNSTSEKEYNILGACICQVDVDMLTGEHHIERVDLLEDVGKSMSPQIDVGQIEGAFVMGLGNHTTENMIYGDKGQLLTNNTWNYKIPGAKDIPEDFRIKFRQDSSNPDGVLNAKATGEPALSLSISIPLAIRRALDSAMKDASKDPPQFIKIDGPTTVEYTLQNASSDYKTFTL